MQKFIMLFGCLLLLALFGPTVNAQDAQDAKADTVKVNAIYQIIGYEGKFAIGLKAGLPGYGGELAYNFHDHWNVRLGGMFL